MMKLILAFAAALLSSLAWAAGNPPVLQGRLLKGEVLEVKDVDPYSYLRLKTKDGDVWAAVSKAPVRKGAEVTIENAMVMKDFQSKSLNRTFDYIVFGALAGSSAGAGARPAAGGMSGAAHGQSAAADAALEKVAKAKGPDARTVAEIFGKRAELKDKPVALRAKVVKVTANVMGRNWVHLRDGSGSAGERTNDVLVRTGDAAQVGSVVVARGVVRTDVDLGMGYTYKVLIDDAKLQN